MQIISYLNFNGDCQAAFKFYEECLRGKIVGMHTHADAPEGMGGCADWKDKIMHVRLQVGDAVLMGSDCPPEYYEAPKGIYVSLMVETPAEADRIFQELAEGGTVQMPIAETFWAVRFGMVTDRFGTPWMVNCEKVA